MYDRFGGNSSSNFTTNNRTTINRNNIVHLLVDSFFMKKELTSVATFLVTSTSITPSFGWSFSENTIKRRYSSTRRDFIVGKLIGSAIIMQTKPALSANLPASTGADFSKTGTVEKLVPIVKFRTYLEECKILIQDASIDSSGNSSLSPALLKDVASLLNHIPTEEKLFKKIFDEYSDPVSYKQKYMDQNAFLVYYTKGFDGPNRDSIESGEIPRQTLQYGARNECWNAFDDLITEAKFGIVDGSSTKSEIFDLLNKTTSSFDRYLSIAPQGDSDKARASLPGLLQ